VLRFFPSQFYALAPPNKCIFVCLGGFGPNEEAFLFCAASCFHIWGRKATRVDLGVKLERSVLVGHRPVFRTILWGRTRPQPRGGPVGPSPPQTQANARTHTHTHNTVETTVTALPWLHMGSERKGLNTDAHTETFLAALFIHHGAFRGITRTLSQRPLITKRKLTTQRLPLTQAQYK
jgi:hypothetical protein